VLQMHVEGRSQHEIAAKLDVSQPAVSKTLKRIEDRYSAELGATFKRLRANQVLKLQNIYNESIKAWHRSLETGRVRRRQRKADGAGGAGQMVAEIVSENSHGDSRYLEAARRALADLRALQGLTPPIAVAVDVAASFQQLTDDQLAATVAQRINTMRQLGLLPHSEAPQVIPQPEGD
jgi:hypothetical protein